MTSYLVRADKDRLQLTHTYAAFMLRPKSVSFLGVSHQNDGLSDQKQEGYDHVHRPAIICCDLLGALSEISQLDFRLISLHDLIFTL